MSGKETKDRILKPRLERTLKPKPRLKFVAIKNAKDHKEAEENNREQYKASGYDLVEDTTVEMFGVSIDDLRQNMFNKHKKEVVKSRPDLPIKHVDKAVREVMDTYDEPIINGYIDYANELLSDGLSEEDVKKRLYNLMKINPIFGNKEWKD